MPSHETPPDGEPRRYGVLFYLGAGGLLVAMTIEAIAVVGRHLSTPLLGALEVIQAAILITATSSMLSATLLDAHATVRLLVERLSPTAQLWLHRFAFALSSLFFLALSIAAAWLAIEAWNEFEHSELLQIPYRPLRIIVVVMTTAVAGAFAYKVVRRATKGHSA